jgi:predicted phosphodiesterase
MKRFASYILVLVFVVSLTLKAEINLKPYIQALAPTSVYVLVESTNKSEIRLLYGTDANLEMFHSTNYVLETTAKPVTYVHRIQLENLKPGTKYYYKALQEGVDTELLSFTTPKTSGLFRFGVTGDSRSAPKKFAEVLTEFSRLKYDYVLLTGDLAYKPEYKYWREEFFIKEMQDVASKYGFFNAVGNHEQWATDTKAYTQAPLSPSGKQEYYSVENGDFHLLILSTEHSLKKGSDQYKFVESELKRSNKKWKIVVWHKSAYVGGGHGDYKPGVEISKNLFTKYGVDLVLSGHSHFYQRNIVDGITHVTVAGGGAPLYTPEDTKYTQKSAKQYHFAYFELDANKISFKAINIDGKVIDDFTLTKK